MKKQYLILTAVTVLALAAMSCGLQFTGNEPDPNQRPLPQNSDPGPQRPGPQNNDPGQQGQGPNPGGQEPQGQGPQNGDPGQQGQMPNPGEAQIVSFSADQMNLNQGQCTNLRWETRGGFGVKLNGQPVPAGDQQQVCPTQTTLYELGLDNGSQTLKREVTVTVTGGNQSQSSGNPGGGNQSGGNNKSGDGNSGGSSSGGGSNQIDLQATGLWVDNELNYPHYLHIKMKNKSSYSGYITYNASCTVNFRTATSQPWSGNLSYSGTSAPAHFNANEERSTNSGIVLDQGTGFYKLTCQIIYSQDNNNANNTVSTTGDGLEITP